MVSHESSTNTVSVGWNANRNQKSIIRWKCKFVWYQTREYKHSRTLTINNVIEILWGSIAWQNKKITICLQIKLKIPPKWTCQDKLLFCGFILQHVSNLRVFPSFMLKSFRCAEIWNNRVSFWYCPLLYQVFSSWLD